MKLSEAWIREWVNPKLKRKELIATLNMAGLETTEVDGDVLEFELTPNRSDCLSVSGMAREIAALTKTSLLKTDLPSHLLDSRFRGNDNLVSIENPADCPRYTYAVIKNLNTHVALPKEIQQKLASSGISVIHPIVDIMNYVMLELGQPLHAFDLAKLDGDIHVRRAKAKEKLTLLDNQTVELNNDVLVIADGKKAQAMAGVMGGLESAVTENTKEIFIESAFFVPQVISGRARRYGLHTDASHRFERGVDCSLPEKALARAIELIQKIIGGDVIAVGEITQEKYLPQPKPILLHAAKIEKHLGIVIDHKTIEEILTRLHMQIEKAKAPNTWQVTAPSYRFDIEQEVDLIEEIIRVYGYAHLPEQRLRLTQQNVASSEKQLSAARLKKALMDQGFQEVINYSFISAEQQQSIDPEAALLTLANPLSNEYAVMRSSLWPGLLNTVVYNFARQQQDLRFFEIGRCFVQEKSLLQPLRISAVMAGNAYVEQWAQAKKPADFFDMKGVVEQLIDLTGMPTSFQFVAKQHPALHPAQAAQILYQGKVIGWCGVLHPEIQKKLDIVVPVVLFELELDSLLIRQLPVFKAISKFPAIRRDLAMLIDHTVCVDKLKDAVAKVTGDLLQDFRVFDVYQGKNIPVGKKSIAIGLVFQACDRTLIEDEINALTTNVVDMLQKQFNISLRQ